MPDVEDWMHEGEHSAPTSCIIDGPTIDELTPGEDWRARVGCTREVRHHVEHDGLCAVFLLWSLRSSNVVNIEGRESGHE
jgi:hypothetical protein